jgi:biotin carboxyl carrier protein
MKMEMPVEAPSAGKVASIAVTPGQAVEEGDLLLELE